MTPLKVAESTIGLSTRTFSASVPFPQDQLKTSTKRVKKEVRLISFSGFKNQFAEENL
jgi:hypothetical protein